MNSQKFLSHRCNLSSLENCSYINIKAASHRQTSLIQQRLHLSKPSMLAQSMPILQTANSTKRKKRRKVGAVGDIWGRMWTRGQWLLAVPIFIRTEVTLILRKETTNSWLLRAVSRTPSVHKEKNRHRLERDRQSNWLRHQMMMAKVDLVIQIKL